MLLFLLNDSVTEKNPYHLDPSIDFEEQLSFRLDTL